MKKLSALIIAVIFAMAFASYVYAGSADARTASTGKGISQVNGLGDLSTGNTAEIDAGGNLMAKEYTKSIVSGYADINAVAEACKVYSIILTGDASASAGDSLIIYDALTATGTPKFEARITAAGGSSQIAIPGGVTFDTGVYVDITDGNDYFTIVYGTY